MQDSQHIAGQDARQTSPQDLLELRGQIDFGHHEQDLPTGGQHLFQHPHIDFGFPATRYAMQQ